MSFQRAMGGGGGEQDDSSDSPSPIIKRKTTLERRMPKVLEHQETFVEQLDEGKFESRRGMERADSLTNILRHVKDEPHSSKMNPGQFPPRNAENLMRPPVAPPPYSNTNQQPYSQNRSPPSSNIASLRNPPAM